MRFIFVLLFAFVLVSCESNTVSEPAPKLNFPPRVAAIIRENCLGGECHSRTTLRNEGLVLSSWDALLEGSRTVNSVIPYHARLSQFFLHINTDLSIAIPANPRMPLGRNSLSKEDQRIIFDWIESGAPSDDGSIPYADATRKVFVANEGADYITYVDADTRRLIGALKLSNRFSPWALTLTPDKQSLLVASASSDGKGRVQKYAAEGFQLQGEIETQLIASEIGVTPNGIKGYLANYPSEKSNRFGVFDPVAMQFTKYIQSDLIRSPRAFALSADGSDLYVTGFESDNVLHISTTNDSIITNLLLGAEVPSPVDDEYEPRFGPSDLALSNDGQKLFVCLANTEEVVVFDLTQDSIIARIPVHVLPDGIAVSADGKEVWVANTGSNAITIIDANSYQVITTLQDVAAEPVDITFTKDGFFAYVACIGLKGASHHTGGLPPSSLVIIEVATRKVLATIELPNRSFGVAIGY